METWLIRPDHCHPSAVLQFLFSCFHCCFLAMESGQHAQPDWSVAMQPHSYTKVRSNVHFDTFQSEVTWTFPTVLAPVARLLDQTKRSSTSNPWLSVHYCLTLTSGDLLHPTRVASGKCSDPVIELSQLQTWKTSEILTLLNFSWSIQKKKKEGKWLMLPTNRYYNEWS